MTKTKFKYPESLKAVYYYLIYSEQGEIKTYLDNSLGEMKIQVNCMKLRKGFKVISLTKVETISTPVELDNA